MDWSREWAYFPVSVIAYIVFLVLWTKFRLKQIISVDKLVIWTITGIFFVLGIDVLQRQFEVVAIVHVLKISLGVWILLGLSFYISRKNNFLEIKNNFKADFKINLLPELLGLFLIGLVVYALT